MTAKSWKKTGFLADSLYGETLMQGHCRGVVKLTGMNKRCGDSQRQATEESRDYPRAEETRQEGFWG